ncbi:MAG: hypothetical protein WA142_04595 [Rugosibacter sp.]
MFSLARLTLKNGLGVVGVFLGVVDQRLENKKASPKAGFFCRRNLFISSLHRQRGLQQQAQQELQRQAQQELQRQAQQELQRQVQQQELQQQALQQQEPPLLFWHSQ